MSWKLIPESNRKKAQTKPVSDPSTIKSYWDREDPVYHSLVIKVLKRTGSKIQFAVWDPETGEDKLNDKGKAYTLDLADYLSVMNDLPSTAAAATKAKPYGLVFVTDAYAKKNKISLEGGGSGKVPKPASL